MINTCVPSGTHHGWGVAGDAINKALAPLADGWLVPFPMSGSVDQFGQSSPLYDRIDAGLPLVVDAPLLQAIRGVDMMPVRPNLWSSVRNVGLAFVENNVQVRDYIPNAKRYFDTVIAGSSWCETVLRDAGLCSTGVIIQGIDHATFKPCERTRWRDTFNVFIGGKAEARKGTDIAIRAVAALMEKHSDVRVAAVIHNPWPQTLCSLAQSSLIKCDWNLLTGDQHAFLLHMLTANGIPVEKILPIAQPVQSRDEMATILGNCDVGCFPNRCEGGTNLVLMEAMACGLPCVASSGTGHTDVVSPSSPFTLERYVDTPIYENGQQVASWPEPDLDEVVGSLECAYSHRGLARAFGLQDCQRMQQFTWEAAAKKFYEELTRP
jgi:glycosyltransferase involved in cell wall biosynthesis